jgi:hypothetical protein
VRETRHDPPALTVGRRVRAVPRCRPVSPGALSSVEPAFCLLKAQYEARRGRAPGRSDVLTACLAVCHASYIRTTFQIVENMQTISKYARPRAAAAASVVLVADKGVEP